ncbi:hypothetical protein, partial [Methylobacterium frigidaeris]|uniref:hypothetical protein n=1 Tax=Methylobacterium frigidaeris TaxID=2038277 RepID=UPI001EDDAD80
RVEEVGTHEVVLLQVRYAVIVDILGFRSLILDKSARDNPGLVAVLKSLLTSNAVNRRRSGTSKADKSRHRATLVVTA